MDKVFKALADPTRRKLLDRLHADNGQTLGALCEQLGMTRQAVTKHLALLEDANLVATVWQGREKLHYLNPVPIHAIAKRWIKPFEHVRLDALAGGGDSAHADDGQGRVARRIDFVGDAHSGILAGRVPVPLVGHAPSRAGRLWPGRFRSEGPLRVALGTALH